MNTYMRTCCALLCCRPEAEISVKYITRYTSSMAELSSCK